MLISFTVANFRSIKEPQTLSFEATRITEHPENIQSIAGKKLLKAVAIYGPNSSGKSNLLKAYDVFRFLIVESVKLNSDDLIPVEPFLLDEESSNKPTSFETSFVLNNVVYRYGIEVFKGFVKAESLIVEKGKKDIILFQRDKQKIEVIDLKEAIGLEGRTKHNTLFLTVLQQFNISSAVLIIEKLKRGLSRDSASQNSQSHLVLEMLNDESQKAGLIEFIRSIDVDLNGLSIKDFTREQLRNELMLFGVNKLSLDVLDSMPPSAVRFESVHSVYNINGELVGQKSFPFDMFESDGTKKLVDIAPLVIRALEKGFSLFVDELDSHLHPLQVAHIIELFNSEDNKNGAQLIFTLHNPWILDQDLLRRDQVYFMDKNTQAESDLYSLVEFKNARKDSSFGKDYFSGKYGALPFIRKAL